MTAVTFSAYRSDPPAHAWCSACQAPIEWMTTSRGRKMPVNLPFTPDRVYERTDGIQLLVLDAKYSHFATCPDAARFRQKRATDRAKQKPVGGVADRRRGGGVL